MLRMNTHHLKNLIDQHRNVIGLFLDKIRQLSPVDFILEFSQNQSLFFSLNHSAPFLAFNVTTETFPGGGELRVFGTDLRQFLGGRLTGITVIENDAIIKLDFTRRNNLLDSEVISLVIELIPNHPQAILVNTDYVILSAYRYPKRAQYGRLIQKGVRYEIPHQNPYPTKKDEEPTNFFPDYVNEHKEHIFKQNYEPLFHYLDSNIKKLKKLIVNYQSDLSQLSKMPLLYHHASLLLAEKPIITGQTVQINDEIIAVDPRLNAIRNADLLFKKAKKLKKSESILKGLINEIESRIAYLELIKAQVDLQPTNDEMLLIYEELGLLRVKTKKETLTKLNPYFIDYKDTRILFGKNNKQNDYLTHKLARKSDTFMHIKQVPGAHIIIPGSEIEKDVLEFCGQLALYLSKKVDGEVSYVLVKTLKKGPFPGQVLLRNEKTFYLRFNPALETVFRNQIKRLK